MIDKKTACVQSVSTYKNIWKTKKDTKDCKNVAKTRKVHICEKS